MTTTTPVPRMSKAERREQLLDAAADLLVERGAGALTMEGLAAAANVSKALPYSHFENSDDVIAVLFQREVLELGTTVVTAIQQEPERGEERLRVAIGAFFDFVERRGDILSVLYSTAPVLENPDAETGPSFVAALISDNFDIDPAQARVLGELTLAVLNGATGMWARAVASRDRVQRATTDFLIAALRDASTADVVSGR